jgi:hypothetical protein
MFVYCYVCSVYSVSLGCSVYCLFVNVYSTTVTGCQPNRSYQIYHMTSYDMIYHISYHWALTGFTIHFERQNTLEFRDIRMQAIQIL